MRDYSVARGLFGFMGFVGWGAIIFGVIVALVGFGGVSSLGRNVGPLAGILAAMPGIVLAMVGALILVFVQTGRAGIDTAENTQEVLAVSRAQLDFFKASLKPGAGVAAAFASADATSPSPQNSSESNPSGSSAGAAFYGAAAQNGGATPSLSIAQPTVEHIEYRGKLIQSEAGVYHFEEAKFGELAHAKSFIDRRLAGY